MNAVSHMVENYTMYSEIFKAKNIYNKKRIISCTQTRFYANLQTTF